MTNPTQYHCHDCGWSGIEADLASIDDIHERVATGELMAAGQCPPCGSLVSVADDDVPDYTLESVAKIMQQRGWSVTHPGAQAEDADTVRARIEADLRRLRVVAEEPISIRYGAHVSVEVRPQADDDRVSVWHERFGFVAAKYTEVGVEVDVGDGGGDLVQTICLTDLDPLTAS